MKPELIKTNVINDTNYHIFFDNFYICGVKLEHQIFHVENSVFWISRNEYWFNDDEISYIRSKYLNIIIINENAEIDEKDNVKIERKLFQSIFQIITKQIK